jgi:hypothetical protein
MYLAGFRANRPALAIRGISDLLYDKTGEADRMRQPMSSANAASFAFALLDAADSSVLQRQGNPEVVFWPADYRSWRDASEGSFYCGARIRTIGTGSFSGGRRLAAATDRRRATSGRHRTSDRI